MEELGCRTEIEKFEFSEFGASAIGGAVHGKNWPVVYLLHNKKEIYVGETSNAAKRIREHLKNPRRGNLTTVHILFDGEFNKSAVLDIEQTLIRLYSADNKYTLQNMNEGQSSNNNYYQREAYLRKVGSIWDDLIKRFLAKERMESLLNRNLFKYSPYTSLTDEQTEVCYSVIEKIVGKLDKNESGMSLIQGGAGTGKTVVAIKIISMLNNAMEYEQDTQYIDPEMSWEDMVMHELRKYLKKHGNLKIGFVVPMTSMRATMKSVFSKNGKLLGSSMVIGPNDVLKKDYDILFVDESHRLTRRINLTSYGSFDSASRKLGFDPVSATQLDWIKACSRYQVLFYDPAQSVKSSDMAKAQFDACTEGSVRHALATQMRCKGGNPFTDYLTSILDCRNEPPKEIDDYDFAMFEDVDAMVGAIKKLDAEIGLCRNVAGYSWEWISKGLSPEEIKERHLEDISIGEHRYIWNSANSGWILSKNAVDEIGSIHTVQGFDLNYVGVIFGEEIDYDPVADSISIDRKKFYDAKVKAKTDDAELKTFIINTYKVLMTRGIMGCYVYCCNKNLGDYLKKYINVR